MFDKWKATWYDKERKEDVAMTANRKANISVAFRTDDEGRKRIQKLVEVLSAETGTELTVRQALDIAIREALGRRSA